MIELLETTVTARMTKQEAQCLKTVLEFYRDRNGHMWRDVGKEGTVANFVSEALAELERV